MIHDLVGDENDATIRGMSEHKPLDPKVKKELMEIGEMFAKVGAKALLPGKIKLVLTREDREFLKEMGIGGEDVRT